jgi:predicted DsbA family dithiol-disulfide isomerase
MEISIQGVTKANYELVIDEDVFNECCEEAGLDPANFKKFTKDQWDELNPHLVQAVVDNEQEIDYTEIHAPHTVYADTLTINDRKHMTTVYYEQDRKTGSVEIL